MLVPVKTNLLDSRDSLMIRLQSRRQRTGSDGCCRFEDGELKGISKISCSFLVD